MPKCPDVPWVGLTEKRKYGKVPVLMGPKKNPPATNLKPRKKCARTKPCGGKDIYKNRREARKAADNRHDLSYYRSHQCGTNIYHLTSRLRNNPPATMMTGSQNIPAKSMTSTQGLLYTGKGTVKQAKPGEVLDAGWGKKTLPRRYKGTRAPVTDPAFSDLPAEARAWKKSTFKGGSETDLSAWQELFETKYKDSPYIATLKVDGEGVMAHFDGKETVVWNWYDRWRADFHITDEFTKLMKKNKVKSVKLMGELYAVDRYGKMLTLSGGERDPNGLSETVSSIIKTTGDKSTMERQKRIRLAIFDILELNGEDLRGLPFEERIAIAGKLVKGGKAVHLVPMSRGVGIEPLMKLWEEGMQEPEFEGVVIRFNDGGKTFKVKGKATADLAIIGFYHGSIVDTGSLQNAVGGMALAFMDEHGDYVFAGNTGSFQASHDERRSWLGQFLYDNLLDGIKDQSKTKWGSHLVDPTNKHMPNGKGAMWPVKPTKIAEVHYHRASFKENPVYRVVGKQLVQVGTKRSPTLGGPPVFMRFRDDKQLTPEDLRIGQLPAEGEGKWLSNPVYPTKKFGWFPPTILTTFSPEEEENHEQTRKHQKKHDAAVQKEMRKTYPTWTWKQMPLSGKEGTKESKVLAKARKAIDVQLGDFKICPIDCKYCMKEQNEIKKNPIMTPLAPLGTGSIPKTKPFVANKYEDAVGITIPNIKIWPKWHSVEDLQRNPNDVFLFGDNDRKRGKGGQAQIRGEPNAVGIRTKKRPATTEGSYYDDRNYEQNIKKMKEDFIQAFAAVPLGGFLIIPKDGLGTGLAELDSRAPKTFAWLREFSEMLNTLAHQPHAWTEVNE